MMKTNVRRNALEILLRIEKEGSFSHLLLSQTIEKQRVSAIDENLLIEIVYGTLERKLTLDYFLQAFIKNKKKIDDWVVTLLRMSIFQMEYLDNVPTYAVLNEAVEIAKQKGHKGTAAFVNGVLRNIQRKGLPNLADIQDPIERIAIETSHPTWLVARWTEAYGIERTKEICQTNITKKKQSLRVNTLKSNRGEIIEQLAAAGIEAGPSPYLSEGIIIEKGTVLKTDLMKDGYVSIQDQSSMLAAKLLDVSPEQTVLDACSAPGGKATYIAEMMENQGTLYAFDLHKNKTKLIEKNAQRLGLTNIKVNQSDARKLQAVFEENTFDRILIDAPCSGLGVIRSKPEIKYSKQLSDIEKLHEVQLGILNHVAPLLKEDGKLVYSTCTMDVLENEGVVEAFLQANENYAVDESLFEAVSFLPTEQVRQTAFGIQLFPQTIDGDGFFITRLIKK